jgi:glycosyltransferase 2 family protein
MPSLPHSALRIPHSSPRRRLWPIVKWSLFLLVLFFVGRHARHLWGDLDSQTLQLRWGWLALAIIASVVAWVPSIWYWRQLLSRLGWKPSWLPLLRAYYCSHPAKYVPGKALVILLRATLLRSSGVPAATTAYTVTLETLTYMAAGVVTMVLLLPTIVAKLPQFDALAAVAREPIWRTCSFVVAIIGSLVGLGVLSRLSVYFAKKMKGAVPAMGTLDQPIPVPVFARGLLLFLGAWWLQGMTLGLTLQAISPSPIDWNGWPLWTGAAAVSMVGGFLAVFAPGGLGVREGLLIELLREQVGPQEAVAAALLWRAVTLVGELLIAGTLFPLGLSANERQAPPAGETVV